jgi:hypothetical protein
MAGKQTIKIELTPAQQEQLRQVIGKQVTELEVNLEGMEQLENRIAPAQSLKLNLNT